MLTDVFATLRRTLPAPGERAGCFSTEAFLFAFCHGSENVVLRETAESALTAICRKIEIGRALCVLYPENGQGKSIDGVRVGSFYMVAACAVLLQAAAEWRLPWCLNCALKLLDGHAAPHAEYPAALRDQADALLTRELSWWAA